MSKTVPDPALKPSRRANVGVVRRVRALAVAGWTRPYLASELGIAECHLTRVYSGRVSFPQLAVRINALYDRLTFLEAPDTPSGWRTSAIARGRGWLGADAWTPVTIDDPDARPISLKVRICIEDLQWMADTGERLSGACRRLDVEPETLWRRLDRAHRTDLWQCLASREAA